MEETTPKSPNLKTRSEFVSLFFREAQIMAGRMHTTFYLPLMELACILLKIEVYNAGPTRLGRNHPHPPQSFYTKS